MVSRADELLSSDLSRVEPWEQFHELQALQSSRLSNTSMPNLLNLSTRPSVTNLRLFKPSLRAIHSGRVFNKMLSSLCGNSVLKCLAERVEWDCQGVCPQGWAIYPGKQMLHSSAWGSSYTSDSQHLAKIRPTQEVGREGQRQLFQAMTTALSGLIVLVWSCPVANVQPLSRVFSHLAEESTSPGGEAC